MIETSCGKMDCFFRVGTRCCNLCAKGESSCDLYWPADKTPGADHDDEDVADERPPLKKAV